MKNVFVTGLFLTTLFLSACGTDQIQKEISGGPRIAGGGPTCTFPGQDCCDPNKFESYCAGTTLVWCDVMNQCSLKIFGLKSYVKESPACPPGYRGPWY